MEIKVPAMGESVTSARIARFLKPSGSRVERDEEIVELETDKVNQPLYAPCSGVVTFEVGEGDEVAIGQVIGRVEAGGEVSQAKVEATREVPRVAEPAPTVEEGGRETRRPLSKIRKTIASRLVEALHSAAMLTTFNEVDMSRVMALREKHKESFLKAHGVKLGFMSFFVKAVVEALKAFPVVNSSLDGEEVVERHYYDIGIAVGAERGLVVPVVRGADRLSFAEVEKEIEGLAAKARTGRLSLGELQGGSFTITNGGVFGSLLSTPLLNPPQSGILGMHKIEKRAVVVEDQVVVRPMMYVALSYDHRLIDGREAILFLGKVKEFLESPPEQDF